WWSIFRRVVGRLKTTDSITTIYLSDSTPRLFHATITTHARPRLQRVAGAPALKATTFWVTMAAGCSMGIAKTGFIAGRTFAIRYRAVLAKTFSRSTKSLGGT